VADLDLSGKTVVVTGASRGIGAAIAEVCLARGMKLGVCARSAPSLAASDEVLTDQFDITDERAVDGFTEAVAARFGEIDLWINNAGVLDPIQPLRDVSVADFRTHIDINLTGVFLGTRAYARHRRGVGGGGILVNISSGAAWHGYAGWGAYCAGKGGVERLTDCIALEEAESGLRAHTIAPGVVDTDMQARIRECSPEQFPAVEQFKAMKQAEVFNSSRYVGEEILALAFDPARRTDQVAISLESEKR
jgi:NAD(P)-dependent dehydrogenase (short-subunit alcohol dehydrogenase family)